MTDWLSLLLFAVFFFVMMRYGCGAHMLGGHRQHKQAEKAFVDPVCDMEVLPDQGYGLMYQGQPYRFCSRRCLDRFEQDPQRYLKKENESA